MRREMIGTSKKKRQEERKEGEMEGKKRLF